MKVHFIPGESIAVFIPEKVEPLAATFTECLKALDHHRDVLKLDPPFEVHYRRSINPVTGDLVVEKYCMTNSGWAEKAIQDFARTIYFNLVNP